MDRQEEKNIVKKNKERFLSLCKKINREGVGSLINWLENSDFFRSPASTRFHSSYNGGLLEHSLNVYDEINRLLSVYPEIQASPETIIIISLLHDICKANSYQTEKRNRKNEQGRWESYDAYTFKEKLNYGGHGSKSVFIIQSFIKLTAEEAVSINCHMSAFSDDWKSVGAAFEQFPLAWLLSVADQSATFLKENIKEGGKI